MGRGLGRGRWSLLCSSALVCACSGSWPFAAEPCIPSAAEPQDERTSAPPSLAPVHLRQLGYDLPVAESPPATGDGWAESGLTGRVVVRQSLASARGGYVWGVEVETEDGGPLLLQPLPMRTRAVGLRLSAGDYFVSTYRQSCLDGCAGLSPPTRHCRTRVHVEAERVVDLGESAPDRDCRLVHRPPEPAPALASVGVRHIGADASPSGWALRVVEGDTGRGGETAVALAASVDALTMWVEAGHYTLETHGPAHPERAGCRTEIDAHVGESVEVVHTHTRTGCRPYRTDAPLLSAREPEPLTPAGR